MRTADLSFLAPVSVHTSTLSNATTEVGRQARSCRSAPRGVLLDLFEHALARVDPMRIVAKHLPPKPRGRTVVIGAGKASARMAAALEQAWDAPLSGLVVTRYGHGEPCERLQVIEAGHPVPDRAALLAGRSTLESIANLTKDDLVVSLISGGGSSLMVMPRRGLTLDDKQELSRKLLRCGASIGEINIVRTAMSEIKGGRLARACGAASLLTLVISDVPGDDPSVVASGPTIASRQGSAGAALGILQRYRIQVPAPLASLLGTPEPEAPSGSVGARDVVVIATAQDALDGAGERAAVLGIRCTMLGGRVEAEAREAGRVHAGIALHLAESRSRDAARAHVVLSGGETTVTVKGDGRGGRNAEFLLGFGLGCAGASGVHALACDTDGIDGSEDNAGAFADGSTVARAAAHGLDARDVLERNDAYTLFQGLGDLIVTGPTRTNVNDFRAVLVE